MVYAQNVMAYLAPLLCVYNGTRVGNGRRPGPRPNPNPVMTADITPRWPESVPATNVRLHDTQENQIIVLL